MRREEKDGEVYWYWEPHELEVQRLFERCLLVNNRLGDDLAALFLEVKARAAQSREEAWRIMGKALGTTTERGHGLIYNFGPGCFRAARQGEETKSDEEIYNEGTLSDTAGLIDRLTRALKL